MVGAGGIGCELLKNLVLTGFGSVCIVDLDTIDLSNLNRQFLFRQEHIKKSKALVAKESAAKFNPHVNLEAHHANIKDPQFNIEWFKTFDIIFNALDNLDARRHVNKMCLAANVPLIESGTTGFKGQVQIIKKGVTECYDCNEKEVPKSFPVCTIRSTPTQPIHCIVWAKSYLFNEIFGTSEDEMAELDHTEDSENAKEIENLRNEAKILQSIRNEMGSPDFARKVFEKVFTDDVNRLRSMEDMWKTRKPPTALDFESTCEAAKSVEADIWRKDQKTWKVAENFAVFVDSLQRLSARLKRAQQEHPDESIPPVLSFDKDDDDALDFVAAAANLRSVIFGIETKSKFDIKEMAGNIIPAIATTNAMTAGLCILQAFQILRDDLSKAKMVFLEQSTARVINTDNLRPPNPNCNVCGVAQSRLVIDPERATLNDLVQTILVEELGYGEEFTVNSEAGILYDPEFDDNLPKRLSELRIKAGDFLTVIDDDDDPRVNLSFSISEQPMPENTTPIVSLDKIEILRKPKTPIGTEVEANSGTSLTNGSHSKRKRSIDDAEANQKDTAKRFKVDKPSGSKDNSIRIEDDGAIVLDDD